jgi:hypothetical protein
MADRGELLAEHGRLRQARGDALLAGETFDDVVLADIDRQLEHAEDREGAERRLELAQADAQRVAFVERLREEIATANAARIAALGSAERWCELLTQQLAAYFAAVDAIGVAGHRLGHDVPVAIGGRDPAIRISRLIGDALRRVAPEGSRFGDFRALPQRQTLEEPASWVDADAAADVAVAYLTETPSLISGETA